MRKGSKMTDEQRKKLSESHANQVNWMKGKKIDRNKYPRLGHFKNHTEEARRKMSESLKGKKKPPRSEEYRKNISLAHLGKHFSEESRRKMSLSHKGKIPWNKGKNGLQIGWMKGKHHTEETRRKISEANKGKLSWNKGKSFSEESRRKMSESQKKRMSNPEVRKRMSESHKGLRPWRKGKKTGKPAWNRGKPPSEEARKHMSLSHIGKPSGRKGTHPSLETLKKLRESHKGQVAWNRGKSWSEEVIRKLRDTKSRPEYRELARERRAKQIFPKKDSNPEIKIQKILKQLGIDFISHKYIAEIEHRYRCDIFIPSMNLVIEVDGDYWHGNINNPQYKILNKHQVEQKERDNMRTNELQKKGFKVLRLWESDIKKMNVNDFIDKIKLFF